VQRLIPWLIFEIQAINSMDLMMPFVERVEEKESRLCSTGM